VNVPAVAAVGLVRAYQWTLRPVLGSNCRFHPSCSDYAAEALARHGAARGGLLAVRRVLRCNPWNEGGFDPAPPAPEAPRRKIGDEKGGL
jgi:putative membrane protein insertion efficiency factor